MCEDIHSDNPNAHDNNGNASVNSDTIQTVIPSGSACNLRMEKPKLPKFAGDVRECAIFKADFKHAIKADTLNEIQLLLCAHVSKGSHWS